jgi:hypothetical protein
MISLFTGALGLFLFALLFKRNRVAFVAGFFILFSLGYRILDVVYVDLFGPIYAVELDRYVGGNLATPMFVLSCLAFLLPLWFFYRPAALELKLGAGPISRLPLYASIRRWTFLLLAAFIGIVYLDMLRKGTIPLLVGMDRLEYNLIAGVLHNPLYSLSFLLAFTLGTFTVLPRLQGGRYDLRFAMLFLVMLAYWILTGNRFSVFYRDTSFFVLPFAAVFAMERYGRLARITRRDAWSALLSFRVIVPIVVILSTITVVGLLINSYYDVRGYADPVYMIGQRTFVQPIQLWDATWSTLDFDQVFNFNANASEFLFRNPIEAGSNTSIQYLMVKELGYFRAASLLLNARQQYAGGYPEILFELFGAWLTIPILFIFGTVTAWLLRLSMLALSKGRLFTCLMAVYVYYGFTLTYIGGMLNFLFALSFFIKLVLLGFAVAFEGKLLQRLGAGSGAAAPAPHRFPLPRTHARESAP